MDHPQLSHEPDLSFVGDQEIRDLLSDYYRQASLACTAGAYVGSIALSGGVLEGLLTWALSMDRAEASQVYVEKFRERMKKRGQDEPPPLEEWKLSELIEVSVKLQYLGEKAKKTAYNVQDFRNYIHPYNARKSSWRPDESLALIALRLVDKFGESLSKRLPPAQSDNR